jgi:hypothetical protein
MGLDTSSIHSQAPADRAFSAFLKPVSSCGVDFRIQW